MESESGGRHICCSMTSVLLRTVADEVGDDGVTELLSLAGSTRARHFLERPENWVSLDEAVALLEAAVTVTGDPTVAERIGQRTVQQHAGTGVSTILRSLGSPEAVLGAVAKTTSK